MENDMKNLDLQEHLTINGNDERLRIYVDDLGIDFLCSRLV